MEPPRPDAPGGGIMTLALPLQIGYNQATQIRWPGECLNTPRPWPTGGNPVDVHDSTIPAKTIERFWSKVDQSGGPDACWPWTAGLDSHGYGSFRSPGSSNRGAHRFAFALTAGGIPSGMFVCHTCDNRRCCNPAHLWVGTNADNTRDRDIKGRRKGPAGTENGNAKLSDDDIADIRTAYNLGESQRKLAARFGVCRGTIWRIVTGQMWRHLPTIAGREIAPLRSRRV